MRLQALLMMIFISIAIIGCEEGNKTDIPNIEENFKEFSLSADTVRQNESFTIQLDVKIIFDVDIRIREKGSLTDSRSIYYSTNQQDHNKVLTFDYANGKITMKGTVTNVSVAPGEYELFIRLCEIDGTGFVCSNSSAKQITLLAEDALVLDFGYYLQTVNDKLFSKSAVTKTLPVQNSSNIAKQFSVQLSAPNQSNRIFSYVFATHGLGVFTIAPNSYDNLTISTNTSTLNSKDNYTTEEKFKVAVDNISKEYSSKITVLKVAEESCSNIGENPCNGDIIFTISNERPLASILFDKDTIVYLNSINATVTFDKGFFDKFSNDNRTTCRIQNINTPDTLTLDYKTECFLFLKKKLGGESHLTISGNGSRNNGKLFNAVSKVLIFRAN